MPSSFPLEYLAPLAAALTAFALLSFLLQSRRIPLDRPNERSLHAMPVPRIGGFGLIPAIGCAWLFVPGAVPWAIWLPAALLFAVSCIDDIAGLPVGVRLITHVSAAALSAFGLMQGQAWLPAVAAILAIAWMTNLFNFMDGSDGLAGGMAMFGFSAYALAAWISGHDMFALACLAVATAAAAFLAFNFHPARVFLGDAGSIPLGFLAAALGIFGWTKGLWPVWFPPVVFSPFIVDASVTLVRRFLRGARIWQAHRDHYYQRLVRHGWGHRRTALAEYVVMGACAALGLAAMHASPAAQLLLIGFVAMGYLLAMFWVDRHCRCEGGS